MDTELKFRSFKPEQLRAEDGAENKRTVKGYAMAWYKLSEDMGGWRERIAKGAFSPSVASGNVFAFWSHDRKEVLARTKNGTLRLHEDDYGLAFEMDLQDTSDGRDAYTNIRSGNVDAMSFGFYTKKDILDRSEVPGEPHIVTVLEGELLEISPVAWAAYPQTNVELREKKSMSERIKKFEEELLWKEHGTPGKTTTKDVTERMAQYELKRRRTRLMGLTLRNYPLD